MWENCDPKKTKNSTNEASMLLKTKIGISKRTQNEPQLSAQMREIEPKFEPFDIAHVPAGDWIVGGCGRDRDCPAGRNAGDRERIQKYREQSQNVAENKAHHFFVGCESGAFGAPIGTSQALKGAGNTTIWENEVRAFEPQSEVVEGGQIVG
jgi:hypothetical protein